MEAAATEQLQSLARKSETALKSLRSKLDKAEARIEEFQALIKVTATRLPYQTSIQTTTTANKQDNV